MREERQVSVETLANHCGVSTNMIYQIEIGNRHPHVKLAKKIGEFFGLTIEELWDMFYSDD